MMRFKEIGLLVFIVSILSGCDSNTYPFNMTLDKSMFQNKSKKIVLLPFNQERDSIRMPDQVISDFNANLRRRFEKNSWIFKGGTGQKIAGGIKKSTMWSWENS